MKSRSIWVPAVALTVVLSLVGERPAVADTTLTLPTAGDQFRVVHPRNDATFGERITLTETGKALIKRQRGFRQGEWKTGECVRKDDPCVLVRSKIGETTLIYQLFADGTLIAKPSSGPAWSWSYELGW